MKQYVVTISRQFGSMGRMIAQQLSRELGVEFYDRDIVEETASRMGLPVSLISNTEENSKSIYFKQQYPLGMGVASMRDEIFMIQKNIIRDLAQKESCIIVGRCADSILMDMENHLNVYIYAPMDARVRNAVELAKLDEKTARKMIREIDRSRELYHRRYCPEYVDPSTNKDIMLDSGRFGAEGTVKILAGLVRELFG